MYWLLDYAEQENLRQRMIHLQSTILNRQPEINRSRFFLSLVERAALLQEH